MITHDFAIYDDGHIWLKFSQLIKYLLFYIPLRMCNDSLNSIEFIASVYEPF